MLPVAAVRDDAARHEHRLLRHRRRRPLRARDLPRRRVPRGVPVARVAGRRGDLPGDADRHVRPRRRDGRRARERHVNQVAVVNVNAAAPVGNGRASSIDPEGAVRYEAGRRRGGRDGSARPRPGAACPRARQLRDQPLWEEMDLTGLRAGARPARCRPGAPLRPADRTTPQNSAGFRYDVRYRYRPRAAPLSRARTHDTPLATVVSTAAQSEHSTASSVASTAAWKSGSSSAAANDRSSEVANATKISPLPWWATEPARASPRPARRASRSRCCVASGASVARTAMQLPPGVWRVVRPLVERPAHRRRRREAARWSRSSSGAARRRCGRRRDGSRSRSPFQSKQLIPAPAPAARI